MGIKISKVAKELNVGIQTIRDFFAKKKMDVDTSAGSNSRIDDEVYNILIKEFKPDMV